MTGRVTGGSARLGCVAVVRDVSSTPPGPARPVGPPRPLLTVGVLVALQGLGVVGLAVFLVLESLTATTSDLGRALVAALIALLAGAGLLLVGRALLHGGRWARSPALVVNLIAVPVSIGLLQGGRWYVGAPLLLWAVAVVVLLFSGPVNAALEDG
jgi:hypothetical protein